MTRATVKVIRKSAYDRKVRQYNSEMKTLVKNAALITFNNALMSLQRGKKSGDTVQKYNPRRVHTQSAPGEAPATDTGYLASHLQFKIDSDGLGADVESTAEYSAYLEFGTSKMAERPFLQPALEEARPKIRRLAKNVGGSG